MRTHRWLINTCRSVPPRFFFRKVSSLCCGIRSGAAKKSRIWFQIQFVFTFILEQVASCFRRLKIKYGFVRSFKELRQWLNLEKKEIKENGEKETLPSLPSFKVLSSLPSFYVSATIKWRVLLFCTNQRTHLKAALTKISIRDFSVFRSFDDAKFKLNGEIARNTDFQETCTRCVVFCAYEYACKFVRGSCHRKKNHNRFKGLVCVNWSSSSICPHQLAVTMAFAAIFLRVSDYSFYSTHIHDSLAT